MSVTQNGADVKEKDRNLVIAEGRIGEMLLEKYDPRQFHVIVPTHVITIPEEVMELEVSIVHISPNPNDKMVYSFPEAGDGMMALGKKAIEAVANAAGLKDEGTQEVMFVPGQYAIVKATVSATLPNGEVIPRTRSKNFDVEARMEEFEYALRDRIAKGTEKACKQRRGESDEAFEIRKEAYVQEKCTKRRHHMKKFLWELADTGAHLRAMQALLPSLKPVYHVSELQKPFVIPRIPVKPAITSNKLLAEAVKARARQNITELFGPIDRYEDLPPELAEELREKDRLLAELVDEFESGQLVREEILRQVRGDDEEDKDSWELLQEAYHGDAQAGIGDNIQTEPGKIWPARPWDAETLKRYLNEVKVPGYEGNSTEPTEKQLDFLRSLLDKIAPSAPDRHTITLYLFDEESTGNLSAAQCSALINWTGAKPPDYEPSKEVIEEAKAVIRQYQIDRGQTVLPL